MIASHGVALAWGLASRSKEEGNIEPRPAASHATEERVDVGRFLQGMERGSSIEANPVADGEELIAAIRAARGARDLAQLNSRMDAGFPEFKDWCKDFADSRMTPDEVLKRVLTAFGETEDADGALREYLFRRLFPMQPVAAVDWLRLHRQDNWQGLTKLAAEESLHEISIERMFQCAEGMSFPEMEASGVEGCLSNNISSWRQRDPDNCMSAVQGLPAGPLKERMLKRIAEMRPMP